MLTFETFRTKHSQDVDKSKVRVLIVDDEDTVRRFVDRVLREAGYTTALAAGGHEAITLASTAEPFDLLVTDLMMPHMSGDELSRRLRQTEPQLKVLYLTGYSDRLFREKVTLWADEAFLDKRLFKPLGMKDTTFWPGTTVGTLSPRVVTSST